MPLSHTAFLCRLLRLSCLLSALLLWPAASEAAGCHSSLLGKILHKAAQFLQRHDLMPFELGSEAPPLRELEKQINAQIEKEMNNEALRMAWLKSAELSEDWENLGEERDFGTFVEIPKDLQGEVVAGLMPDADGRWQFVSGKIVRVLVVSEASDRSLRTRLQIHGLEGFHFIDLPGALHLHRLKKTQGGFFQRSLQKIKTLVENKSIAAKDYLREIAETKGFRIILRVRDLRTEQDQMRWAGLIRKESSEHGKMYWVFHPIRSLSLGATRGAEIFRREAQWRQDKVYFVPALLHFSYHHLYQRPASALITSVEWLHQKTLGPWKSPGLQKLFSQKLEFSAPVNIVAGSLIFIGAYQFADSHWTNEVLIPKRLELIEQIQDELLFAVQTDPFLSRVETQWRGGLLSDREAAEEAFLRLDSLSIIYELMRFFPEEYNRDLLEYIRREPYLHSIFPATLYLDENGPQSFPGISVPKHQLRAATDDQMIALIQINRDLFHKRPLIQEWVWQGDERIRALTQQDPVLQRAWDRLQEDPYTHQLWALHHLGAIDEGELLYLLLENLQWQEKFKRWALFEAERYILGDDGEKKVLALADFQERRLRNLFEEHDEILQLSALDFYPYNQFNNRHLLDRLGPDLAFFYVAGALAPVLRRFIADPRIFQALVKNRYKSSFKSKRMKAILMLTTSGELRARHQSSSLASVMTLAGTLLIAWDVYSRVHQLERLEPGVRSVLQSPLFPEIPLPPLESP